MSRINGKKTVSWLQHQCHYGVSLSQDITYLKPKGTFYQYSGPLVLELHSFQKAVWEETCLKTELYSDWPYRDHQHERVVWSITKVLFNNRHFFPWKPLLRTKLFEMGDIQELRFDYKQFYWDIMNTLQSSTFWSIQRSNFKNIDKAVKWSPLSNSKTFSSPKKETHTH